ncbi:hypothetical protein CQA67_32630, partial [Klebsiella pneumoniae]
CTASCNNRGARLPSSSGDMDSLWWSMNKINASPQAMLIVRLAAAQAPLHWQLFAPGEPAQRPATIGAHVYRRPAAIWTLYGGR